MIKCGMSNCKDEATGEFVIGGIHFSYCSKHYYEAVRQSYVESVKQSLS